MQERPLGERVPAPVSYGGNGEAERIGKGGGPGGGEKQPENSWPLGYPEYMRYPILRSAPLLVLLCAISGTAQTHGDLHNTVTVFVGGFDPEGSSHTGVFGQDVPDPLMDLVADMMGVHSMADSAGLLAPDVVTMAHFYGEIPPPWWTERDQADLDAVMAEFGGGVPRYALIEAKFARHVLDRTGADHLNLFGASFGGLITRYIIRHDVENLVSDGHIIRWQTLEGANSGSWVASDGLMQWLWDIFSTPSIDVEHLVYSWVDENLDSPRDHMGHPSYGQMLVGHTASTNDGANGAALTTLLFLSGDGWETNDGVLLASDGAFKSADADARSRGRMPTQSWHAVDHYGLADYPGVRTTMAAFASGNRRFTLKITGARFHRLPEGGLLTPWPAEVAFDLVVRSPVSRAQWGIDVPISERSTRHHDSPLFDVEARDQWETLDLVVFDDMLLREETSLDIEVAAWEFDVDEHYDMWEIFGENEEIGQTAGTVPIANGSYRLNGAGFDLTVEARVHEYPFGRAVWLDGHDEIAEAAVPLSGAEQVIQLDFGPAMAGRDYRIYGGMSGSTPPLDLGNGILLPVKSDRYTRYIGSTLNTPLHHDFAGVLDRRGRATALLNRGGPPFDVRAANRNLVYAAAIFDGVGGALAGSEAVLVRVR